MGSVGWDPRIIGNNWNPYQLPGPSKLEIENLMLRITALEARVDYLITRERSRSFAAGEQLTSPDDSDMEQAV
jgi:hypothetical protein